MKNRVKEHFCTCGNCETNENEDKAPAVYVQVHVEGSDKHINEKTDGMFGVTFKESGDKQEINAIIAMPPSVHDIKVGFASLATALTLTLFKGTSADLEDIDDILHSSVKKGMADAVFKLMAEENPEAAKKAEVLKDILDLLDSLK